MPSNHSLDVAVFKSFKDHFSKAVRSLSFTKKIFIVTKREFSRVVKSPFEKAFSIPNIKSVFAKCGIYPFNPNAVSKLKNDSFICSYANFFLHMYRV